MTRMIDRPLAAAPFTSYRYQGPYGGIAIGAMDDAGALREAARSLEGGFDNANVALLQRWDGEQWVPVA